MMRVTCDAEPDDDHSEEEEVEEVVDAVSERELVTVAPVEDPRVRAAGRASQQLRIEGVTRGRSPASGAISCAIVGAWTVSPTS